MSATKTATLSLLFAEEFTVCEDCFSAAAGLDDGFSTPEQDADRAADLARLCPTALSLVPGDALDEFSTSSCDSCGSRMGGSRHALTALRPRQPGDPIQPSDVPEGMLAGYLQSAAFADYPEDTEPGLTFGDAAQGMARDAIAAFLTAVHTTEGPEALTPLLDAPRDAGRDIWLTRQGHGAGFWDGDWDATGHARAYTDAAKALGETMLEIIADDEEFDEVLTFW
jgi:hypothetical protein